MFKSWPAKLLTLTPCTAASVVWRHAGNLNVTVVVKATFRIVADGKASLTSASPIVERERHIDKSPTRSLEAASEVAPFIPDAGVILTGHAVPTAAGDHRAMVVRLRVSRQQPLIDKTVHVYGEAVVGEADRQPFESMPLVWERAYGSANNSVNPVGAGDGGRRPNLLDPADPNRPACFGPLAWTWPERLARLGSADRQAIQRAIGEYPDDLDFGCFQAAPNDQRTAYLYGDERILLVGTNGERTQIETQLPGAHAHARAVVMTRQGPTIAAGIPLVADMLVIDADREELSVVWRGHRPFAHPEDALANLALTVGVELPGKPVHWPEDDGIEALALTPEKGADVPLTSTVFSDHGVGADGLGTITTDPLAYKNYALPFSAPREQSAPKGELPIREGGTIPTVAAAPYDVGVHHWQIDPPKNTLIVIVKGTYDIVPDGPATAREPANFITGERFYDDDPEASVIYPDDLAIFKSKADVLMLGHAHAPEPGAVATAVTLKFGSGANRFERTVHVFGDRVWQRGLATAAGAPHPFEKIPLVYERAYGGPGLSTNPVGRGHDASTLMPNFELPGKMVTSPSDKHRPACFAPVAMEWDERWGKIGTYDRDWFKKRWPYFPADFDWSFFQAAPPEQRLDYLTGDEPFEATGVHSEVATIRGQLAGERARAFILTHADTSTLEEVLLRLDTVTFDFDAMTVDVVWRGLFEVSDNDAPEARTIFAMAQRLDEEDCSVEQAYQLMLSTLAGKPEEEEEDEPAPQRPPLIDPAAEAERLEKLEELDASVAAQEQRLQEEIAKANLPPGTLDREPPPPDPEALAATLREAGASPVEVEQVLAALRPPQEQPEADEPPAPTVRDQVIEMLHEGASFAGFDFDASDLSDLDFAGRELTGADLQGTTFQRANFAGANLAQAQLGNGDFTEACFDKADLSSADLTSTTLHRASFKQADLTGTELSDAHGHEANFAGATGEDIFFSGGNWLRAVFDGAELTAANFSGADIGGASFRAAKLAKINISAAHGADVCFDGSLMTAVRGEGCKLHRCSLQRVDAPESVFENAELFEANLSCAKLSGSNFVRAHCERANFSQSELVSGNLSRAKLAGADFQRANLMMAVLDSADLSIADLRGANLHASALVDTNLLDAKLGGAITTKSSLVMKPFGGAR